jgi:prepilin-type N-terminal cleavage/methylation domain-containing protein
VASRSSRAGPGGEGGFVLLEILVALVIFSTLVLAYSKTTDDALEAAAQANADRTLRLLTSRMLAEVRAKPMEFVDGAEGGFDEPVDYGSVNPFLDYHWTVEAEEMTVAGVSDENDAVYLFERDRESPPATPEGQQERPRAEVLVRLVLTVSHLPEGTGEGEKMRVVTWVPPRKEEGAPGAGN